MTEPNAAREAAATATPLVTQALTVCDKAGLDLAAVLLGDVLAILVDLDDYLDVPPLGPQPSHPGRAAVSGVEIARLALALVCLDRCGVTVLASRVDDVAHGSNATQPNWWRRSRAAA